MDAKFTAFYHKDHLNRLKLIDFYQSQIMTFQKELVLVLHRHSDTFSIIEHVDEYRNILLKKLELLDNLRRQIILHEKQLSQAPGADAFDIWDHKEVRFQMDSFEKSYEELKQGFRKFAAHHIS